MTNPAADTPVTRSAPCLKTSGRFQSSWYCRYGVIDEPQAAAPQTNPSQTEPATPGPVMVQVSSTSATSSSAMMLTIMPPGRVRPMVAWQL